VSESMSAAEAVRARLASLMEELAKARKQMTGAPVPKPEELDSLALEMAAAREELHRVVNTSGFEGLSESERASIIRMASAVRTHLGLVANLASGGARYAAIIRGIENAPAPGIYGPGGMAAPQKRGRVEEQV